MASLTSEVSEMANEDAAELEDKADIIIYQALPTEVLKGLYCGGLQPEKVALAQLAESDDSFGW